MILSRTFNAKLVRPILIGYLVAVTASAAVIFACYPKNCDPKTDPLKCQCPPGVCGPYPDPSPPPPVRASDRSDAGDAGKDGAR